MSETEGSAPPSPETPSTPFDSLPEPVARALAARGFVQLTSVQKAVASADTASTDLRISSQTGSGKTVAVGIAIARALLADGPRAEGAKGPSVLVLAPTRELAGQVRKELDWLLAALPDSTTEVVTGGTSVGLDRKNLSRRPRVLVGTPGRVLDHLNAGVLQPGGVSLVVLDEADQMLDMGFREELEAILALLPTERRTHLVSATFSGEVLNVARRVQKESLHLQGSPLGTANTDIEHIAHVVPERHRYDALVNLLLLHQAEPDLAGRTLVFTRTRRDTAEVAERLVREGFKAEPLSGDLAQASRTRTLEAFRHGRIDVIVATDVAARGLDIDGVSLVVHFDPPGDADALTHRSGRTGRAGQKGTSVLLLPPQARRRLERLLHDARITPAFAPVPSADKIQKAYTKAGRRQIFAALEKDPSEDGVAYAQKLLAEHPPERIIATLLSMTEQKPPCPPRDVAFHLSTEGPRPGRTQGGNSHMRGPKPGGRGGHGGAYAGRGAGGPPWASHAPWGGEDSRGPSARGGLAAARVGHGKPWGAPKPYPRDAGPGPRTQEGRGDRGPHSGPPHQMASDEGRIGPRPPRGKSPPFAGGKARKPGLGRP